MKVVFGCFFGSGVILFWIVFVFEVGFIGVGVVGVGGEEWVSEEVSWGVDFFWEEE